MMKTFKKVLAVLMACLFVLTSMYTIASAEDAEPEVVAAQVEEDVAAADEEVLAQRPPANPAGAFFETVGNILFSILTLPLLVVDFIAWVLSGLRVHIFPWLYNRR